MESKVEQNAARSSQAQTLLDKLLKVLLNTLERVPCEACGATPVTPQEISNILKFLDKNGFKVDPVKDGDALDEIIREMNQQKATFPAIEDRRNSNTIPS